MKRTGVSGASIAAQKYPSLAPDQAALRRTGVSIIIEFVRSMAPLSINARGKKRDGFDRWWANMNTDCFENERWACN